MNVQDTCAKHNPLTQPTQHKEHNMLAPAMQHMRNHGHDNCSLSRPCKRAMDLLRPWKTQLKANAISSMMGG